LDLFFIFVICKTVSGTGITYIVLVDLKHCSILSGHWLHWLVDGGQSGRRSTSQWRYGRLVVTPNDGFFLFFYFILLLLYVAVCMIVCLLSIDYCKDTTQCNTSKLIISRGHYLHEPF